ncbi:MAG: sigma-70 family RNA polymerase sigma factor [Planctomycetota bacterium]|jgi:RNA polymerase sigma factor (sigma-70 family)
MLDGTSTESELLRASMRGNTSAFEVIVGRYQSLVCAITFSATGNLDRSEELAHEAFINAWTNLAQLKDLSKFRAWLRTITRNIVRNYIRDKKRDVVDRAVSVDRITDITSGKSEPVKAAINEEEQAVIRQALEAIPESYREPLILFYREQKSLKQVAAQLDLSQEAARTRVSRGRKLLKARVATMIEAAIGRTAPGKAFTTGVVASLAGMAIKGSGVATAVGVASAASGTGATAIIKTAMSGMTAKVIAAAAVAVIGVGAAIIYRQINKADPEPDVSVLSSTAQDRQEDNSDRAEDTGELAQIVPVPTLAEENTGSQIDVNDHPDSAVADADIAEGDDPTAAESNTGVSGIVVDKQTSRPIKGAQVFTRNWGIVRSVVTDPNGRFKLRGIEPSERRYVYAIAEGYATRRIVLAVAENRILADLKMELSEGARVAGIVRDEKARPVAGATVKTYRFTNHPVMTNKDGEFEIDGLDPGLAQYSLHVTHPDYPAVQVSFLPSEAGQTIMSDVVLEPGVTVHGRVTDSEGSPVADVVVGTTTSPAMWNSVKSRTDAEGMYALENVSVGELVIWVKANEHAPYVNEFSLDGSETVRLINIVLDDPWPLRGKIVDSRGNAVPGVRVRIWDYKGVGGLSTHKDYVTCDSGGRFVIPNAPGAGKLTIDVYGEGIAGRKTELEMGLEEHVIVVNRAGRLYGKVVDDMTGEPITKFKVRLKPSDRGSNSGYSYTASWTREGHSFESAEGLFDTGTEDLAVGAEYSLTVYADGFDPLTIDAVVVPETAADSARTEFRLKAASIVAGRIVDTNDVPIAGARIHVLIEKTTSTDDNYDSQDTVVSDSNGWFSLSGLAKLSGGVYVTADSFGSYMGYSFNLPQDPNGSVRIVLSPGARIFGRVFGPDGNAVSGARMWTWAKPKETVTDEDGYYEFVDVLAGSFSVGVSTSLFSVSKRIDVEPGESVELNFGDEAGCTVSGVVRAGEELVARASVRVGLSDNTHKSGRTDDKGRFQIKGIPEGLWDLRVSCGLAGEHFEERREIVVDANVELDFDIGAGMVSGQIPDSLVALEESKIKILRWAPKTHRDHLGLRADWNAAGIAKIHTDGTFTCSYLRSGKYYVSLSAKGDILAMSDVFELDESESLDDVVLRTGDGGIDIHLLDPDAGEGVAGAYLVLENHLKERFRTRRTDEQGKAQCSRLPSGRYVLRINATGYPPTTSDWITVGDGALSPATVYVERGSTVIFVLSDQVRERLPSPKAWIACRITDMVTGELGSKPIFRARGYQEYDHELYFRSGRTDPAVYLREGRYEIRYSLRQRAYEFQPPLLEGVASVDLAKGQIATLLIKDD